MDSDLIKALAIGISSGLTSVSMIPLIFKGKIVFGREVVAKEKECDRIDAIRLEQLTERDEYIDRLLATNATLTAENKEQNRAMTDQTKEVLNAVRWIQGMAGLAQSDRRRSPRD